jgi:hypothetical protein
VGVDLVPEVLVPEVTAEDIPLTNLRSRTHIHILTDMDMGIITCQFHKHHLVKRQNALSKEELL